MAIELFIFTPFPLSFSYKGYLLFRLSLQRLSRPLNLFFLSFSKNLDQTFRYTWCWLTKEYVYHVHLDHHDSSGPMISEVSDLFWTNPRVLQLPECLRIIGYLRRIGVFNEYEMRLQVSLSKLNVYKQDPFYVHFIPPCVSVYCHMFVCFFFFFWNQTIHVCLRLTYLFLNLIGCLTVLKMPRSMA